MEGEVEERLELLRLADGMIDFSKSKLQLDIMLYLTRSMMASTRSIADALGTSRKAVRDALLKMQKKGLIRRVTVEGEDLYTIGPEGTKFVEALRKALGLEKEEPSVEIGERKLRYLLEDVALAEYVYNAVLALGAARDNRLSLSTLAKVVGLAPRTLSEYLEVYTSTKDPKLKLFERSYGRPTRLKILSRLGIARRREAYYSLTDRGLNLYRSMPSLLRMNDNVAMGILKNLTLSTHPKQALQRAGVILAVGSVITLLLTLIPPIGVYAGSIWIFFSMILGGALLLSFD